MRPKRLDLNGTIVYALYYDGFYAIKRHRNGHPAVIHLDGDCEWWVNGLYYDDVRMYCKSLRYSKMKTMTMILKYGDILPMHIDECDA